MKTIIVKFMDGDEDHWLVKDAGLYSVTTDSEGRNLIVYNPKTLDKTVTYDRISYPLCHVKYWIVKPHEDEM